MLDSLIERYAAEIEGVVSCYDRLVLTGTLTGVCYAGGMAAWLRTHDLRLFDYPKLMEPHRDRLRDLAAQTAKAAGVQIEFIRNTDAFRKEARIKEILSERGETPGLVHIFSAMEGCTTFKPWHDKLAHTTSLRTDKGKCLHYYFYLLDEEFGLCYLRVPTWAPFRLQFYCNGHGYLEQSLRQAGRSFTRIENCFVHLDDYERAQELADKFPVDHLHRLCDRLAERFCPMAAVFDTSYHWSIMQAEYSSDIVFTDQAALSQLYDSLSRAAICAIKAPDVATFLGRKLDKRYLGELGSSFHTRVEGTCIKHHMGPCSVKMYDKHHAVLRIESTTNDVTFFSHYRTVEHRDGTSEKKNAPMQKTIYSLGPLREVLLAINRRYLAFISTLADPSAGLRDVEKLSATVQHKGRGYGGFNLFNPDDLQLFQILARGEMNIAGISSKTIRKLSPIWSVGRISRLLKKLRLHGLIKRVGRTYRYYLTALGKRTILTAMKLRELVVIPALATT